MKKLSGYVEINAYDIITFDDDDDIQFELQKVYEAFKARALTDKLIGGFITSPTSTPRCWMRRRYR